MPIKYYRLRKDLPTFKKGELFYMDDYIDDWGSLYRVSDDLMAYYHTTVAKFPNMLEDWFEEVPAPARDVKTKAAFGAYMALHPDERFFQAVRNFTNLYLDREVDRVCCHRSYRKAEWCDDTFYWECDDMLKEHDES